MRALLSVAALAASALCLAAPPVRAQGVPPNPFASNYPSAPPPPHLAEPRARRAVRAQPRSGRPVGEPGPVPPGRVPY